MYNGSMDQERDRLRDLASRLVRLHSLLMERERRAYEARHGSVGAHELLHLLLHDAAFAWLRSLSMLMARIDEVVDADEPVSGEGAQVLLGEAFQLLKSGEGGRFQDKYRDALQESPEVVMVHASISAVLRR